MDMDVERYLLSSALTGIVSQKLARRLCPHCKELRKTTSYEKEIFKRALGKDVLEIYDAKGCDNCRNGYTGRIAIQEVLLIDDFLRDAINNPDIARDDLRELVYTKDVTTLLQDGLYKVLEGITSFEEIYKLIAIDDALDEIYDNEDNLNNTNDNNNNNIDIKDEGEVLNNEEYTSNTEVLDLGSLTE